MKAYNFEIYTVNPLTGQAGWDIKNRSVLADSVKDARNKISETPDFDCIILYNYEVDVEKQDDALLTSELIVNGWSDVEL